jgi:hypothetical protein
MVGGFRRLTVIPFEEPMVVGPRRLTVIPF